MSSQSSPDVVSTTLVIGDRLTRVLPRSDHECARRPSGEFGGKRDALCVTSERERERERELRKLPRLYMSREVRAIARPLLATTMEGVSCAKQDCMDYTSVLGRFDYAKGVCVPKCRCSSQFKIGDYTPSRSPTTRGPRGRRARVFSFPPPPARKGDLTHEVLKAPL